MPSIVLRLRCSCGWNITSPPGLQATCGQCGRGYTVTDNCLVPDQYRLGDHVARALECIGGRQLKRAYRWLSGRDCGCDRRRRWLNQIPGRLKRRIKRWLKRLATAAKPKPRRRPATPAPKLAAFLSATYLRIGGTETFHRCLLPRLPQILGFGVTGTNTGDASLLGCPMREPAQLAREADIVVTWGIDRLIDYLPNPRPKVISVHHADWDSDWSNRLQLDQLELIDEVVCVHADVAKRLAKLTTKPVHYIPNCIDPNRIEPDAAAEQLRTTWDIDPVAKIVLFSHRISDEKRPLLAIETARHLPPGYVLVIAGNGPLDTAASEAAADLPNVRIVGLVDSPANWLAQASCFISLATYEGFGLAVGEAILAGVPVLSTPVGIAATPGLVRTLESDSAEQWAAAIVDLITSDSAAQTATAKRVCQTLWSVDRFVAQWRAVLEL